MPLMVIMIGADRTEKRCFSPEKNHDTPHRGFDPLALRSLTDKSLTLYLLS